MWTRKLLKENAKIAFQRNYWTCVFACLLAGLLGGGISASVNFNFNTEGADSTNTSMAPIPYEELFLFMTIFIVALLIALVVGLMVSIWVSNVVTVGSARYFLENREHKTGVAQLFYGFQSGKYIKIVKTMFLKNLYIFGWSLLFLIPGIVKSYSYLMVPYILAENPELDTKRALELSHQMMNGHKMDALVLDLSFIGWSFLGALTGGILILFYVNPYLNATYAEFYSAVKAEAITKGIVLEGELSTSILPQPISVPEMVAEETI